MIISRTPFRVSLFGGGTDYPAWFKEHEGAVLGGSIDKYCYITARYLPPHFKHKSRIVYSKEEWVNDNNDIEHPAVRECLKYMGITRGIEITHSSDLLARKGMGSSSAFVVGLLHALQAFQKSSINKERLARQAIEVEQDWIKENVGCQDQYHCAVGGFNHLKFWPDGAVGITPTDGYQLSPYLMMFDTGDTRIASEIAGSQIEQIPSKQSELMEMYHLANEAAKTLKEGQVEHIASLLNASWNLKKRLSDKITSPRIDAIYETAIDAGAWAGKLLGAGGGGYMLFMVEPEKHQLVREALSDLIYVPFKFEQVKFPCDINHRFGMGIEGSQIIFRDDETPERTGWGDERV